MIRDFKFLILLIFIPLALNAYSVDYNNSRQGITNRDNRLDCSGLIELVFTGISEERRKEIINSPEVRRFLQSDEVDISKVITDNDTRNYNDTFYLHEYTEEDVVHLEFEQSVLKQADEDVFKHLALADVTTKYNQKLLFDSVFKQVEEYNEKHVNKIRIIGRYRDFKTLRLAIVGDRNAIEVITNRANVFRHKEFMKLFKELEFDELISGLDGRVSKPEYWFLGGLGRSPLIAYAEAKRSREMVKRFSPKIPLLQGSKSLFKNNSVKRLTDFMITELREIKELQAFLASQSGIIDFGIFKNDKHGNFVTDERLIDVFRKVEDIDDLRKEISRRYDYTISKRELTSLKSYFDKSDFFSPPVYVERQISDFMFNKSKGVGVVAVDFERFGSKIIRKIQTVFSNIDSDLEETHLDMIKAIKETGLNANNFIKTYAQDYEKIREEIIGDAVRGVKGTIFSGDEGYFYPRTVLSRNQRSLFIRTVQERFPDRYRIAFIPPKYKNSLEIPPSSISQHSAEAFDIIKNFKKAVTGRKKGFTSPEVMDRFQIGINYTPPFNDKVSGDVELLISGREITTELKVYFNKKLKQSVLEVLSNNGMKIRINYLKKFY